MNTAIKPSLSGRGKLKILISKKSTILRWICQAESGKRNPFMRFRDLRFDKISERSH